MPKRVKAFLIRILIQLLIIAPIIKAKHRSNQTILAFLHWVDFTSVNNLPSCLIWRSYAGRWLFCVRITWHFANAIFMFNHFWYFISKGLCCCCCCGCCWLPAEGGLFVLVSVTPVALQAMSCVPGSPPPQWSAGEPGQLALSSCWSDAALKKPFFRPHPSIDDRAAPLAFSGKLHQKEKILFFPELSHFQFSTRSHKHIPQKPALLSGHRTSCRESGDSAWAPQHLDPAPEMDESSCLLSQRMCACR